jgi:hypothetical protein
MGFNCFSADMEVPVEDPISRPSSLKQEIESMDAEQLPLRQGLTTGNYAISSQLKAMINRVSDAGNLIRVTAGILYKSVIDGCSCADDPAPVNENNGYCVAQLDIDKANAATAVPLVME